MKNKHIGSTFEDFLKIEGIFEEVNVAAVKAIIKRLLTLNRAASILGKKVKQLK